MGYVRIIKPGGAPEAVAQLGRIAEGIVKQTGERAALVVCGPSPQTGLPTVGFYNASPSTRWKLLGWSMAATAAYIEDMLLNEPLPPEERAALIRFKADYEALKERALAQATG